MSSDLQMLKDYVAWDSGGQNRGESTVRRRPAPLRAAPPLAACERIGRACASQVLLHCTHSNLKARMFEIRLDRHMTIGPPANIARFRACRALWSRSEPPPPPP